MTSRASGSICRRCWKWTDIDVETVSSGREAIAKVSEGERPDFIILDVLMPEMNGIETLKELMQLDRTLNVIMLSCSNEVGTVVEAIRIGRARLPDEAV